MWKYSLSSNLEKKKKFENKPSIGIKTKNKKIPKQKTNINNQNTTTLLISKQFLITLIFHHSKESSKLYKHIYKKALLLS